MNEWTAPACSGLAIAAEMSPMSQLLGGACTDVRGGVERALPSCFSCFRDLHVVIVVRHEELDDSRRSACTPDAR